MKKTFWDYLNDENKKEYAYLKEDKELFDSYDIYLRTFCIYEVLQDEDCSLSYEDIEERKSIRDISNYINYQIDQYNPNEEVHHYTDEELDMELTLLGV